MKKKTTTVSDPHYQPSKKELEEDMRVKATAKKAAKAVMQTVKIKHSRKPKWKQ